MQAEKLKLFDNQLKKVLYLGIDFVFGGNFIILKNRNEFIDGTICESWPFIWRQSESEGFFRKDIGQTFGNGRFTLIFETDEI